VQITFLDGRSYDLDTSKSYEERLQLVNEILFFYGKEFSEFWEYKGKNLKYPTKNTLDILGSYLYYGATKELNQDHGILTDNQMQRRTNRKEIPVGLFDNDTESLLREFSEQHKEENPKKNNKIYSLSKMHKLNTIFIHPNKRKNRVMRDKPLEYRFMILDNQFGVEEKDYTEVIKINCFTKDDMNLPYIDKSKPYYAEWKIVFDNQFSFCCLDCKIITKYDYDRILILHQDGNFYFFDNDINVVKNEDIVYTN
jgi:hypothetical protein